MQLDYKYWEPARTSLDHIYAVTEVRLMYEQDPRWHDAVWKSERTLRSELARGERGYPRGHVPDGELHHPDSAFAVEVELSEKDEPHLRNILRNLIHSDYTAVFYHGPLAVLRHVADVYDSFDLPVQTPRFAYHEITLPTRRLYFWTARKG